MNRREVAELHYISPFANIPLITRNGILCHEKSKNLKAETIALPEVQGIRSNKLVPGALPLHRYANLYFDARNPMMYKRQTHKLGVIRVNPEVLEIPKVVIADGNAASGYTAFYPSPDGLQHIDKGMVFLDNWNDPNPFQKLINARVKCAEALIPNKVDPKYIDGVYVVSNEHKKELQGMGVEISIEVNKHIFFKS